MPIPLTEDEVYEAAAQLASSLQERALAARLLLEEALSYHAYELKTVRPIIEGVIQLLREP